MVAEVGDCPVGCGRKRLAGKMLCKTCWAQVPQDTQNKVWRAWRAFTGSTEATEDAAWVDYCQARNDALAHVR